MAQKDKGILRPATRLNFLSRCLFVCLFVFFFFFFFFVFIAWCTCETLFFHLYSVVYLWNRGVTLMWLSAPDKCNNIIIFICYCFQLNANPSLIQDGVPDMFTLTLSSVKVGFCLQLSTRYESVSCTSYLEKNRLEQTTDWNVWVLLFRLLFVFMPFVYQLCLSMFLQGLRRRYGDSSLQVEGAVQFLKEVIPMVIKL